MLARALLRVRTERGAVATEYAILASMIAIVIIAGVSFFGSQLAALFQNVGDNWPKP